MVCGWMISHQPRAGSHNQLLTIAAIQEQVLQHRWISSKRFKDMSGAHTDYRKIYQGISDEVSHKCVYLSTSSFPDCCKQRNYASRYISVGKYIS